MEVVPSSGIQDQSFPRSFWKWVPPESCSQQFQKQVIEVKGKNPDFIDENGGKFMKFLINITKSEAV